MVGGVGGVEGWGEVWRDLLSFIYCFEDVLIWKPTKLTYFNLFFQVTLCGSQQTVENSSRGGNTRPPTCLLRNLYAGQKAKVRTGQGTREWFQIGKGIRQGCILSACLFRLYAEYVMRNAGLHEAQAGIKIAGRNISNLRYADDNTLKAESGEELKASWWKWKKRVKKLA